MENMKRTRIALLALSALSATVLAGWRLPSLGRKREAVTEYKAEVRELGRSVVERGWLVSLDTVPVIIGATGEIVDIVATGTPVKAGDVIVRLDDADVRETLDDEEFGLYDAEQELASYHASLEYVKTQEENRLAERAKELECAKLEEEKALGGLTPPQRRLLAIELEIGRLDLADAREELERQTRLFGKGFISQVMLAPYRRRVETEEASVAEIEARIRLEEKGSPEEELLEMRKRVERIESDLARGEKARERRLEEARARIKVSEEHVARHMHEKARHEKELAGTVAKAPRDGIVALRLHYSRGGNGWVEYKPGVKRYQFDRLADIVDLGQMKAEFMAHESDIKHVVKGMEACIRLPAYPGREFRGLVTEVGGVGRDRADVAPMGYEWGKSGITMFNASVSLDAEGADLRPGMSAMVELVVEKPVPRLVVDRAAVVEHDGGFLVLQRSDNGTVEREIDGYAFDEMYFVVESGLKEGEVVVTVVKEE